MRAHIITIGDEILIGQIVDTNSAFIAKELDKIGVEVYQISSISDSKEHIVHCLQEAQKTAEIVLITGGLGPTKDDVTKHTFCEFFDDVLVEDQAVLHNIERIFKHHVNRPMLPANRSQALVPSQATVLMNHNGTAPGMWMKSGKTVFISMPGVPFEMKGLMTSEVIPRLQKEFSRPFITLLHYISLYFRCISFYSEPGEGFRFVISLCSLYFRYTSLLESNWILWLMPCLQSCSLVEWMPIKILFASVFTLLCAFG